MPCRKKPSSAPYFRFKKIQPIGGVLIKSPKLQPELVKKYSKDRFR